MKVLVTGGTGFTGTLELDVFQRNAIGRAFYASYGFHEIGRHAHAETGEAELRLRLEASESDARGD